MKPTNRIWIDAFAAGSHWPELRKVLFCHFGLDPESSAFSAPFPNWMPDHVRHDVQKCGAFVYDDTSCFAAMTRGEYKSSRTPLLIRNGVTEATDSQNRLFKTAGLKSVITEGAHDNRE